MKEAAPRRGRSCAEMHKQSQWRLQLIPWVQLWKSNKPVPAGRPEAGDHLCPPHRGQTKQLSTACWAPSARQGLCEDTFHVAPLESSPNPTWHFHSTQQTTENMRNKFRQNQRISKNLAVTTGQKDKMRERIQRKYFLWDNFLKTYVESWVEAKGWEVWGFLFEIFFVLLFVRVRCRKQRKCLSLQINSCKLSAGFFCVWNKAEQQEKRGRKEKKAKSVF